MRLVAIVAAAIFLLDQLTKWLVVHVMDLARVGAIDVFPPYLNFRMAWNTGINFGLLSGQADWTRWVLISVALGIVLFVLVWMRRDPLDCAWSVFRTYFVKGQDFSWKLEDIASHFLIEDALYEHWSQMLPDRILTVNYQELVSDPRPQIERILDFCKLAHEAAVFTPHETKRVVSTASVMQVREPIGTHAIGLSDPYREHLAPFVQAYEKGSFQL